jgi:hypothetical protein
VEILQNLKFYELFASLLIVLLIFTAIFLFFNKKNK